VRDRSRIDWNLLPALDALLTERNVSRAARRLGISQPATSGALARLRRHFDDELLVRRGNCYTLTPLAERLRPLAREAVDVTSTALTSTSDFDCGTSARRFRIAASEYVQTVFAPSLVAELGRRAPRMGVEFVFPFADRFPTGVDVLHSTDGWLAPREVLADQLSTGLLADEWVCVVAADHPTVGTALTLDDLEELSWVAPTIRGEPLRFHLDGLSAHGLEPNVAVATDSFTAVPFLVAGTSHVGVLQGSLARRLAAAAGVRVLPCPWAVQALHLTMWWDRRWESDPAHTWFRTLVEEVMASVDLSSPTARSD
jgi:DNA-binding transcriptional LysR family regulator